MSSRLSKRVRTQTRKVARLFAAGLSCVICLLIAVSTTMAQAASVRRQNSAQPASDSSGLSPAARSALDLALAALQANDLRSAEREARAATIASPRSAVTHNVLGVVLDRLGRGDEALKEFNSAIRIDPKFVSARNNLGRMLAEHGKTPEAIAEFEQVLKSDPS